MAGPPRLLQIRGLLQSQPSLTFPFGSYLHPTPQDHLVNKMTILVLGFCIALLVAGIFLWCLVAQTRKTDALLSFVNARDSRYVDFLVYRAYIDADGDTARRLVTFPTSNIWQQSFEVGALKVRLEPAAPKAQGAVSEFGSIYNWHKSRAIYRRLQQSTPAVASQFLDGLERIGVLMHPERLGVESTNVIDPY
jgi:hypothetical protein